MKKSIIFYAASVLLVCFMRQPVAHALDLTVEEQKKLEKSSDRPNSSEAGFLDRQQETRRIAYSFLEQCLPRLDGVVPRKQWEVYVECENALFQRYSDECAAKPRSRDMSVGEALFGDRKDLYPDEKSPSLRCSNMLEDGAAKAGSLVGERVRMTIYQTENQAREQAERQEAQIKAEKEAVGTEACTKKSQEALHKMKSTYYLQDYPKAENYLPVGEALDAFCSNPLWNISASSNSEGKCSYDIAFKGIVGMQGGGKGKIEVHFTSWSDTVPYIVSGMFINGNNTNKHNRNEILAKIFLH